MRHFATPKYWACFEALPAPIRQLAQENFKLLKQNSRHPSLHFKPISNGKFCSIRVGLRYRALGIPIQEGVLWFWIGSHAEYDQLIG